MNPDSVGDVLAAFFTAGMAANASTVGIAYDNGEAKNFNPKTDNWVRYAWYPALSEPAAIGGHLYRGIGIVDIQVFTPVGVGAGVSEQIARTIQAMFRASIGSGIYADRVFFANVGERSGWYQSQVRVNIRADEPA